MNGFYSSKPSEFESESESSLFSDSLFSVSSGSSRSSAYLKSKRLANLGFNCNIKTAYKTEVKHNISFPGVYRFKKDLSFLLDPWWNIGLYQSRVNISKLARSLLGVTLSPKKGDVLFSAVIVLVALRKGTSLSNVLLSSQQHC
jgi:hypothetical protein